MSDRTALIISCTREQAANIHLRAELERRTVSGYVLRILMRWLTFEEKLVALQSSGRPLTAYRPVRFPGPRTALLLRCSNEEAHRIRTGAKRRATTISWFVLHSLALSWSAEDRILMESGNK